MNSCTSGYLHGNVRNSIVIEAQEKKLVVAKINKRKFVEIKRN